MSRFVTKEKGDVILKKGDRVALIYPSQDPAAFAAAFFACLFSNLVPVPVEAPISNQVQTPPTLPTIYWGYVVY